MLRSVNICNKYQNRFYFFLGGGGGGGLEVGRGGGGLSGAERVIVGGDGAGLTGGRLDDVIGQCFKSVWVFGGRGALDFTVKKMQQICCQIVP